jgi:hypothetical protein
MQIVDKRPERINVAINVDLNGLADIYIFIKVEE